MSRFTSFSLFFVFVARTASACPYCFSDTAGSRSAYYWTTVLLILVPILIGAGAALWIRRMLKEKGK